MISIELQNTRERLQTLQSRVPTRQVVAIAVPRDKDNNEEGRHYTQAWLPRVNNRVRILNPKQDQSHREQQVGFALMERSRYVCVAA